MRKNIERILNSRFGNYANRFFNSPYYSGAIAAVCILCHTLDAPVVGALLLTLLLVPSLLFCKNSFVTAPFFMMCSFVISEKTMPQTGYYNTPLRISVLCILLVFILVALVFNLVWYGKWRLIFKRAYLTASFAILSAVLIVGGMFSPTYTVGGIGTSLGIALSMFFPYTFLINCGEYDGEKTVKYFVWALIASSIVIGAAVLEQYAINGFEITNKGTQLRFGYAISNTAAAIVVLAIPATFYFVYKYKYGFLYMPLIAVEVLIVFATYSRASILVAVPGTAIVATALCFKKKNGRLAYWITFGIALVCVIALCIVFRQKIGDLISSVFSGKISSSGRISLWKEGFEAWSDYPLFGVGIGYLPSKGIRYYSYHCSPLTYLYCCGIVGLAAYIYHRYKTVRLVFSAKLNSERVFFALIILAMIVNALLDIAMTLPPNLLYYSCIFAVLEHDVRQTNDKSNSEERTEKSIDTVAD